jgi:hypothetical protein
MEITKLLNESGKKVGGSDEIFRVGAILKVD